MILGIGSKATEEELRRAYHKQALQWHPDKNSCEEAENKFRAVHEAYGVLSDAKKRLLYDRQIARGLAHARAA